MLVGSNQEDTETEVWAIDRLDDQKQQSGPANRMTRLRFSTTMSSRTSYKDQLRHSLVGLTAEYSAPAIVVRGLRERRDGVS